jgi:WD40 repeat protein
MVNAKAVLILASVLMILGIVGIFFNLFTRVSWTYRPNPGYRIGSVAVSWNGELVVAGGYDGGVYFFFENQRVPSVINSTGDYVRSVAFSSDGEIVASAGDSGVWVYTEHGDVIFTYPELGSDKVAISSDGGTIAAGSVHGGVYLFILDNITLKFRVENFQTQSIYHVDISSDGGYVAAGGRWDKVYLIGRNENAVLWSFNMDDWLNTVAISPDGNYLAAGGQGKKLYLFSRSDNVPIWEYQMGGSIDAVDISSDGEYVAAGGSGGHVYLFDRASGTPPVELSDWLGFHT